ncbi:hypothetical protein GCM10010517_16950 [Streptosporangium fragile]|uniref:Uncharacterized protein n=1 Tax=Streptosporangium fragile TaxID=46186 RepID=A0ABN3VUV8_9ACTN
MKDLLTDATAMGVSADTGSPDAVLPYPAAWMTCLPFVTATATPGSPVASRYRVMNASTAEGVMSGGGI